MHRGSSKGARALARGPETLPLSASPPRIRVVLEVTRGAGIERHGLRVAPGTLVRAALREIGRSPEGCAVLLGDVSLPLDTPIDRPMRLTVVPTFSGG
jgi:sulfur carrier protein ThiS